MKSNTNTYLIGASFLLASMTVSAVTNTIAGSYTHNIFLKNDERQYHKNIIN
jgi:hypothetical protein